MPSTPKNLTMADIRKEIDRIDENLVQMLAERDRKSVV